MANLEKSIADQTDVSLSLTAHVSSIEASNKNLVCSPLSLHVVLSLIASGSSGSTRDQILTFLKSKSTDDLSKLYSEIVSLVFEDKSSSGGPKLSFANAVWVDQTLPLKPTFRHVVEDFYKASANHVDFINHALTVTSEVNAWAENQTNGLIKEVLSPGSVDSLTRLIFTNAIYFKGSWIEKFDASKTEENDFHLLNGNSIKVPFMMSRKNQFIRAFDGFKVLRLPYEQGVDKKHQFALYVLLPDANKGLPSLIEEVSSQSGFLDEHCPYRKVKVGDFRIPKFKISFGFDATKVLKGLGVELPFSKGGLTEMTDSPMSQNLYVSNIFQKSFIEVNEEGTEAAAVTMVTVKMCSWSPEIVLDFVAEHPFMFVIREDTTGVVLFTGHIMNPLES